METNPTPYDDALEQLRLEFITAYEAGQTPTLESFIRNHPKYAAELTEFVVEYLNQEAALERNPPLSEASPQAKQSIARALESLGIPAGPATLLEARQAKNWEPFELARKLFLPNQVIIELERGRISDAPRLLVEALADAFDTTHKTAQGWLVALRENRQQEMGAAYLAEEGDPDAAAVRRNREQPISFARALESARLSQQQRDFWGDPERPLHGDSQS